VRRITWILDPGPGTWLRGLGSTEGGYRGLVAGKPGIQLVDVNQGYN